MHQAVAVGELLDAAIGVVADASGVTADPGRLAQGVGRIGHRQPGRISVAGQVAVGVVAVADAQG